MSAGLEIRSLSLALGAAPILRDVSLHAQPGRITALVGESGSGKSMTLRAAIGLAPPNAKVEGAVMLDGENILAAGAQRLRRLRGARVGMVFQEVMTALNPVQTIGAQVVEVVRAHRRVGRDEARRVARAVLDRVGLAEIEATRYPHQLSGGQRQRVAIAIATVLKPAVLLADEPTTALDVTTQAQVLELLAGLVREEGTALVLVTHDLSLVANYADDVAVMKAGEIVERTNGAFDNLTSPYARALLAAAHAAPKRTPPSTTPDAASPHRLLEVENVSVSYRQHGRFKRAALHDVSLHLDAGEILGVVGESGSGKSTLARVVLGLQKPAEGRVAIAGLSYETRGRVRNALRRQVQIVFQDPAGSFDPRQRVAELLSEPLYLSAPPLSRGAKRARVEEVLQEVGLAAADANRYPHQFSGGQRQRLAIARALISKPSLIVLDEAVSALDVSIRAQILALLADIAQRRGVAYLFISHDLEIVRAMSDRLLVLYRGEVVETGTTAEVFGAPQHPYTRALLAATPRLNSVRR